jgi:CubicO group peptidase (beta-lactamase class C family)
MKPLLVATALALCLAAPAYAQTDMSPEAAEALYLQRYERNLKREPGMGLDSYDTLAPLPGAPHWRPFRTARSIPESVIAPARAYAAANHSSAFMIWYKGRLVEQSYFGDTRPDSLLASKSLAKPLSVIAVGRAIALGKIKSLDDSMADYITEWRGTPKAAITIRELLSMRSGLLAQGAAPGPEHILNRAYLHPYHDRIIIDEYPLVATPGSRYDYSNANGDLVAPLIERATGVSYEDWLTREVLVPLGARGGEIWMNRPGGTPHSGCCAMLPAETYLRLAVLLAQDGKWNGKRLLPAGYVKTMATGSPQYPHAGLGVYVGSPYIERRGPGGPDIKVGATYHSAPYLADDLFLFDGNSNQVVYVIPSKQLVILRTGDKPLATPEWDNAKLANLILGGLR